MMVTRGGVRARTGTGEGPIRTKDVPGHGGDGRGGGRGNVRVNGEDCKAIPRAASAVPYR